MWETVKSIFTHRITWIVIACIAGLILLWYVLTKAESCRFKSRQQAAAENVNAKLKQIANQETKIANDEVNKAVAAEQLKEAVKDSLDATNATNAARAETDRAVANIQKAKDDAQTNVAVKDLEEILRKAQGENQ
jgi:ABC-type Na+ efflux pump permease subunit